jgi:cold shock CspA family protein
MKRLVGRVKFFSPAGYGFIQVGQTEYYVHENAVRHLRPLAPGDIVAFDLVQERFGTRVRATNVTLPACGRA